MRRFGLIALLLAAPAAAGEYPRSNFHEHLLDGDGRLVGSYRSAVEPDDPALIEKIEEVL